MKTKIKFLLPLLALVPFLALLASFKLLAAGFTTTAPPTLDVSATGQTQPTTYVTTNDYVVLATDQLIEIKGTNHSVTLPATGPGLAAGHEYYIKQMVGLLGTGSGTNVVIATVGIDGATSYTITNLNATLHVRSDGTNWCIISKLATP